MLPHAEEWEQRAHIPAQGWRTLGEQGLLAFGHSGEDFLRSAVFLEELGRTGYAGVRAAVGVHAYMAASYLELFGTAEQKTRYLPRIRSGDLVVALAISEDEAGSDLSGLATEALRPTSRAATSTEASGLWRTAPRPTCSSRWSGPVRPLRTEA